jgi:glycosyltransferase involved in cell wall biosynthesis
MSPLVGVKHKESLVRDEESLCHPSASDLLLIPCQCWLEDRVSDLHKVTVRSFFANYVSEIFFSSFVPAHDLPALYEACSVFAFPSILEGYGLPVIEAMAHGAAVVTSRGTSTEEVAGGAAVLVDPLSVESIAAGLSEALSNVDNFRASGLARAAQVPWSATAEATVSAYVEVLGVSS